MSPMVTSHPDDEALRERLLDEFRLRRERARISRASLGAAVGASAFAVMSLERHRPANPLVGTFIKYAEPCGFTLRLRLDGIDDDGTSLTELALISGGFIGTAMIAKLRRIREARGITRHQVAAEHGWKYSTFARIEYGDREPHLSTLQRYARILGGRIDAWWEDL